jgi:hypothetical protein
MTARRAVSTGLRLYAARQLAYDIEDQFSPALRACIGVRRLEDVGQGVSIYLAQCGQDRRQGGRVAVIFGMCAAWYPGRGDGAVPVGLNDG